MLFGNLNGGEIVRVWSEERVVNTEYSNLKETLRNLEKFLLIPSCDQLFKNDVKEQILSIKEKLLNFNKK